MQLDYLKLIKREVVKKYNFTKNLRMDDIIIT